MKKLLVGVCEKLENTFSRTKSRPDLVLPLSNTGPINCNEIILGPSRPCTLGYYISKRYNRGDLLVTSDGRVCKVTDVGPVDFREVKFIDTGDKIWLNCGDLEHFLT